MVTEPVLQKEITAWGVTIGGGGSAPRGGEMIVRRIDLSLAGVRGGRRTTTVVTPDEILNPGGFLLVYVRLTGIHNGSADLPLAVNGKPVDRAKLPLRVPDRFAFDRTT